MPSISGEGSEQEGAGATRTGSISLRPESPKEAIAGLTVRSRMRSATKLGVCTSAYVLRSSSDRSWYTSAKEAACPAGIAEVVDQLSGLIDAAPEGEQILAA